MKTVEELRVMLKGIFDEETAHQESIAFSQCQYEMDAETLAVHQSVMNDLDDLTRNSLKPEALYCVPTDDFYDHLRQMMIHRLYVTYPSYEMAAGLSDKQILAHRAAIEAGDIAALESLRKTPCPMKWASHMGTAFLERRRMFTNLSYYMYVMAHLAKHYGSRQAAQNFLRASSLAQKGGARLPMNLADETVSEFIALVQDGVEELKVAADYFALPEWETFRQREAEAFAKEEARVAAANAGNGKAEA